jgi:hypothetical protein
MAQKTTPADQGFIPHSAQYRPPNKGTIGNYFFVGEGFSEPGRALLTDAMAKGISRDEFIVGLLIRIQKRSPLAVGAFLKLSQNRISELLESFDRNELLRHREAKRQARLAEQLRLQNAAGFVHVVCQGCGAKNQVLRGDPDCCTVCSEPFTTAQKSHRRKDERQLARRRAGRH